MENQENVLKEQKRNEFGLLENVSYVFNVDGTINWRAMIKPEFLVPNSDRTTETDLSKLKDSEILILLGGLKDLAKIRGYYSVAYKIQSANVDYVCTACQISWIPCYETGSSSVIFEALADCHAGNTSGFGKDFLAAIAENRSFVRCVRNFLGINIVSKEEIIEGKDKDKSNSNDKAPNPINTLNNLMEEKGISFERIKTRLIKDKFEGAEELTSLDNIPTPKIFELIELARKFKQS